jgi:hypothetical protein
MADSYDDDAFEALFRYSDAILLANETLTLHLDEGQLTATDMASSQWWATLQTTRILIAHMSMSEGGDANNSFIMTAVAENIRNLYRLVGLDLADTMAWADVAGERFHFRKPNPNTGVVWFSRKVRDSHKTSATHSYAERDRVPRPEPSDDTQRLLEMDSVPFSTIKAEWDAMDGSSIGAAKRVFGHCVYRLIARRLKTWEKQCRGFRNVGLK